jgi:phosphatidylinositol glycan class N
LGINFPKNSLGVVPIDILNISDEIKSKILLGNMRQIYEIFKIENDKKSKSILYRSFYPLSHIEQKIDDILNHIENNDYISSINKILKLIRTIKEGINYVFNYDKLYLKFIVFFGHILYLIFILLFVEMRAKNKLNYYFFSFHKKKMTYISFGLYFFFIAFLFLKHSPFRYYIYTSFPCYFIWRLLVNKKVLIFNYNIIIYVFIIFLFFSLVRNYTI